MKALFVTTLTVDCDAHVAGWNSFSPVQAVHVSFDHKGLDNTWQVTEAIECYAPDVVFYIGANEGTGLPKPNTMLSWKAMAPLVLICSDAQDKPWHKTMEYYRGRGCFSLMVAIDGAIGSPADLSTLTPVDPRPFHVEQNRDIRCGFSGSVGRWNPRSEVVNALNWFGGLEVRRRELGADSYRDHAAFMKRCRMILNISNTGTGLSHHIKGRVLEAGWAGCCLLEDEKSPIGEWLPEGSFIKYRDPVHAAELIAELDDETIDRTAALLARTVREKYRPEQIYGEIVDRVCGPLAQSAA